MKNTQLYSGVPAIYMNKITKTKIYFLLILLLGVGLRLYKLGENSLWGDEAIFVFFRAIFNSGHFLGNLKILWNLICNEALGNANYGYSIFSTAWSYFVKSEFMLRLSSVIFGVTGIIFIYQVGKIFFDKKTGLIAAFILAISPFHIFYSQEFRMYTITPLLALTSVYFLRRFQQNGRYKFLFGYVISHALNFYTHIVTILVLFAQIIFFLFFKKKYKSLLKKWIMGNLVLMSLIIPGMTLTVIEFIRNINIETFFSFTITPVSQFKAIQLLLPIYTFKNFSIGYTASPQVWIPALLLFFILFVWSILNIKDREVLYLCLFCLFIPVFIMYAGRRFLYADRYLISSSVFLYLIISNGIARFRRRYILSTLMLIIIFNIFSLNNLYKNCLPCPYEQRYAVHEKSASREAVAYIVNNCREGDIIFHTDTTITLSFEYYLHYYFKQAHDRVVDKGERGFGLILNFSKDSNDLSVFNSWGGPGSILSKTPISVKGHKRVWLVFSAKEFNQALKPNSNEKRILQWMSKYYIKEDEKYFKGIILYLFSNPVKENINEKSLFNQSAHLDSSFRS